MERLSSEAAGKELRTLAGWAMEGSTISKRFDFPSYSQIIDFVNHVAEIASRKDHHPDMLVKYGSVEVTFTTHDAGGLTMADFDAARAVDALAT
jgi:4a-hydroxytetrahydrobiopterin dehydratase